MAQCSSTVRAREFGPIHVWKIRVDRKEIGMRQFTWIAFVFAVTGCGPNVPPSSNTHDTIEMKQQKLGSSTTTEGAPQQTPLPQAQNPGDSGTAPNETTESSVTLQKLDAAGIERLVASHKGKVVVLDCWSTYCIPCLKEFPNLVALSKRYPEEVACISLSFDYDGIDTVEEQMPRVLEFLQRQGATFENVISSVESDQLYTKLGFASIPAVFVYDQEGKLARRFDGSTSGEFTYADIEKLVSELLKNNNEQVKQ